MVVVESHVAKGKSTDAGAKYEYGPDFLKTHATKKVPGKEKARFIDLKTHFRVSSPSQSWS